MSYCYHKFSSISCRQFSSLCEFFLTVEELCPSRSISAKIEVISKISSVKVPNSVNDNDSDIDF